MVSQSKQLFRQESLERLSSPEKLDQMMQVVSPKAWLPLTTMGFLVTSASIWSVVGRIPMNVNGQAVLIRPRNVVPFKVINEGRILTLNIKPGDRIKKGDVIGTIDVPRIRQQLRQEEFKLSELLTQNKQTAELDKQKLVLQRNNLLKQRQDLMNNLEATQKFRPILREKSLESIAQRRSSLQLTLKQARKLTPKLKRRIEIRQALRKEKAISEDILLQAEQQLDENLTKIAELKAQIKENDRQETDAESQNLQNLNSIRQINTQIDQLDVQQAQLNQQQLEKSIQRKNQVKETRQKIEQLRLELKKKSKIVSGYDGRVLEVPIASGQAIAPGSRLASIEIVDPNAKLMSVMYFADKDGKQVKRGMNVQVTPSTVKRERYGGILGKVKEVTPFPVTNQDMTAVIGNENIANNIAQTLSNSGGSAVQIFAELERDSSNPSRFQWSSSEGPELNISPGTTAQVRVQIGEVAPISYVIPIFRSLTGLQ
ncbi:NHLP bacteriocin system secretion protein [Mastigocoleus testarum]|uniref:NHLP bacteriocin system secretion protein n=1 Tax=Mastigocoleus testarum BC008 TaxID=371196 RepID=A0A0V7ZEU5_9CYAN|nr:NHLP bacteriocin system secretion protein [Mastigocoleus testarum]KST62926.1 NHLP bacteriocin system secretion protein [Mastigocoleus testarum BC008]KST63017.1 NHLP bacteriocin system secretion protein [Mastigocoleus testarum BC008]